MQFHSLLSFTVLEMLEMLTLGQISEVSNQYITV